MPSQFGQDRLVLQLLNGKRDGFFLDTGAADGVRSSNTELLEREFGWRGLCIEPNTGFYDKLIRARRCACLNACLYDRVADLPFLEAAGTLGGLLNAFDPGQLAFAIRNQRLPVDAAGMPPLVTKRTMTIATALSLAQAPPVIDYWSLDTEGSELLLLQSFPFDEHTFNVITVEHNHQPARVDIRRFLEARGFVFVTAVFIDDCYVRAAAFPNLHSNSAAWRKRINRPAR
ncbi:FkbM family methyltransferase [Pseudoduganella sp. FT26W]|uniref:FkbM family methyltransferase n=1 Tax=Duganella aquatilis TaxID=2666082 RepID=A0A844D7Z7_9BURK|nr:FkbM family methyltransferase [Duganella aquatilis]MRW83660.1 FkbM family methyltransferase [Duganella aquatilis]